MYPVQSGWLHVLGSGEACGSLFLLMAVWPTLSSEALRHSQFGVNFRDSLLESKPNDSAAIVSPVLMLVFSILT